MTAERMPVLVVEDNFDIREAIRELLVEVGYQVEVAASGRAALDYFEKVDRKPCIVLLDLVMPDIDGHKVLDFMRKSDHLFTIPVVVVTAGDTPPPGVRFLKKPIDLQVLIDAVASCCGEAASTP